MQQANIEWLAPNDEGEETVFELEPEPVERAAIVDAIVHEKIRHRWETDTELVVSDDNADTVDSILDEVLGVETRSDGTRVDLSTSGSTESAEYDYGLYSGANADNDANTAGNFDMDSDGYGTDDSDGGDVGYVALSQLYLTVDRLLGSRDDDDIMEFATATGTILMSPPPLGVDDETWADIQSAARNAASALEADGDAPIDADLKALRNQVHELV